MKKLILSMFSIFMIIQTFGQKNYVQMADSDMKRNPEAWMLDFSKTLKWNYCHGLVMQSILQVYDKTDNTKYYDYVYDYADTMVNADGTIKTYKPLEYNIDRVNTGKILFPILAKTKEERFKIALDHQREQMRTHPRTKDGSFWHKKVYPHQVWLDGLYMAGPFLAQYAKENNEAALFDDVALQIVDVRKYLYDSETGLYFHGWDESKQQRWADPKTGLSPHFWSRSIGWYMMAIVDVLDFLPEDHKDRPEIIKILQELSASIEKFRDTETGMWYQVTDLGDREGNYLESTGSIMFIYTWIKGAQKGYLDKRYLKKGEQAYDQYLQRFVKTEADGSLSIMDCCSVAGLGGEKNYRDGSFEYYISEPIRDNDPKAIGPFIMTSVLLDR
ncbi:glycoside hydrolase family 105 protein [Sphingobacterium sp. SGR-19]|uniref:glycoside hydrolase family 88/105 protein n=1 Tax=Sphingobacterium sp. SGR-19 TaxID=2710886 RepID=UPI0013EA3313|nr:glycoside hydrolase family 88 protein [Sphingobacterium sp. SGR-19]NGM65522.1 glycoside hydrolase family 88 protein [Sphingobacterium sp. SGR-19]